MAGAEPADSSRPPRLTLGGRIEFETATLSAPSEAWPRLTLDNSAGIRRARLLMLVSPRGSYEVKVEYDVNDGKLTASDVFVGLLPKGAAPGIRLGHMKEPFGLSALTSSNFVPFVERPVSVTSFAPLRNAGVLVHGRLPGDRFAWAAGVFHDSDGHDVRPESGQRLTARASGLVLDGAEASDPLLHLGAALSRRESTAGFVRLGGRTATRLGPGLVDTGMLAADRTSLWGMELAARQGRWWLQAEALRARVELLGNRGLARLGGHYVQAGWYLTRDTRPYHRGQRTFARLQPRRPFPGGAGAWELTLRHDRVDLDDGSVTGGRQRSLTAGLNWHLRSDLRAMLNHVKTDVAGGGSVDLTALLLHVDF